MNMGRSRRRSFDSPDHRRGPAPERGRYDELQNVNGQQMVVVRSELQNEDLLLKPDMTGVAKIYCGDRRIADLITRRMVRWIRTEFWDLLP